MNDDILIERVMDCDISEIKELYIKGEWWNEQWDYERLKKLIKSGFGFVVATTKDKHIIGMGRIISDGVCDAYLQDIFVRSEFRGNGIGSRIVEKLLSICQEHDITWIGVIAAPETEYFYRKFGFSRMGGYAPMLFEKINS